MSSIPTNTNGMTPNRLPMMSMRVSMRVIVLRERILTLKSRLDDLGVSVPSTDNFNPIDWYYWLPKLVSWADTKNLYEAKTYDARRLGG